METVHDVKLILGYGPQAANFDLKWAGPVKILCQYKEV